MIYYERRSDHYYMLALLGSTDLSSSTPSFQSGQLHFIYVITLVRGRAHKPQGSTQSWSDSSLDG